MAAYDNGDLKTVAAEFQKLPKKNGFVLYTLGVMFENGQGVAKIALHGNSMRKTKEKLTAAKSAK